MVLLNRVFVLHNSQGVHEFLDIHTIKHMYLACKPSFQAEVLLESLATYVACDVKVECTYCTSVQKYPSSYIG